MNKIKRIDPKYSFKSDDLIIGPEVEFVILKPSPEETKWMEESLQYFFTTNEIMKWFCIPKLDGLGEPG